MDLPWQIWCFIKSSTPKKYLFSCNAGSWETQITSISNDAVVTLLFSDDGSSFWLKIYTVNIKKARGFLGRTRSCRCAFLPGTKIPAIFIFSLPFSRPSFTVAHSPPCVFQGIKQLLATKNTPGPSDKKPLPPHMASESHICLSEFINPKTSMKAGFSR